MEHLAIIDNTLEEDDETSAAELHALLLETGVKVSILKYNPIYSAESIDAYMRSKMLDIVCDKTYIVTECSYVIYN